jgi:hypothetical protein
VWWDRESLHSIALAFHQQIKDAIHQQIDRLIYIAGPKAALSDYGREEGKFALEGDKPVIPLLRLGDFDLLPGELRPLHCDDFRDDDAGRARWSSSRLTCAGGSKETGLHQQTLKKSLEEIGRIQRQ